MQDMPKSAVRWYKMWISNFPESWHHSDLERFYMFVSVLLATSRKERGGHWLEQNLREDCRKLSDQDIEQYCLLFEHIRDFAKVWKSQQAKLIGQDDIEKRLSKLAQQ